MEESNCQPRILCLAESFFESRGEIKPSARKDPEKSSLGGQYYDKYWREFFMQKGDDSTQNCGSAGRHEEQQNGNQVNLGNYLPYKATTILISPGV